MNKIRRDNKGRVLHNGEEQLSDGRYRFRYVDYLGKRQSFYSWRLMPQDPQPDSAKWCKSLREIEREIQMDAMDHIIPRGGNLTVLRLVETYVKTKNNVRPTTKKGYNTVINLLKRDPFGNRRIDTVRICEAKRWLVDLQQIEHKSFSSVCSVRGVLKPAFKMAMDDDFIRKNPFDFNLGDLLINDSIKRNALSRADERRFLEFVKNDKHFSKFYDGMFVLFNTGLRISEFCGLTIKDIDFQHHCIHVDHQLQKDGSRGYYIQKTKTNAGTRTLPIRGEVEEALKRIVQNRCPPIIEPVIDGMGGFLFFDKDGSICYALHWDHYFKRAREKYNSIYKLPLPPITPHICRHTYCTKMVRNGMSPKALQYLMGHSEVDVTLNVYTHIGYEEALNELDRMEEDTVYAKWEKSFSEPMW